MIGIDVLPGQLSVPKAMQVFDSNGRLSNPEQLRSLDELAPELVRAARQQNRAVVA